MKGVTKRVLYADTGVFSKMATHYVTGNPALQPFYQHLPSMEGVEQAIEQRKKFNTNRKLLVERLTAQYLVIDKTGNAVSENIRALANDNCFTICTAHQNNIFTGPAFFIYKILHAIKLADVFSRKYAEYKFVPVYYMGSEDADLDELNHIYLQDKKYIWETGQTGAVGRMKIDQKLLQLIDEMEAQLGVLPFGHEAVQLLRRCYIQGDSLQIATFKLVHELFSQYGLLVLIPDDAGLKSAMIPVFEDELLNQSSAALVEKNAVQLEAAGYKAQAHTRNINLQYLDEGVRSRIELKEDVYTVAGTNLQFDRSEIITLLKEHPEKFSPNVILRGIFQETILPNIVFLGGGGELAYWMQLNDVFQHFKVPYPLLVLRNSYMVINDKQHQIIQKLQLREIELFQPANLLVQQLVKKYSTAPLSTATQQQQIAEVYEGLSKQVSVIDSTLSRHIAMLEKKVLQNLQLLEKKMYKAEKRKFADQEQQILYLKNTLFPNGNLQERVDNFFGFYALWGKGLMQELYEAALTLEQEFVILTIAAE